MLMMEISFIFLILLLLLLLLIYISNNCLKHVKYEVETDKLPDNIEHLKIVHITDVHSKLYGENNKKVIDMVNSINPDFVVMTGDIISKYEKNIDSFIEMYKEIYTKYIVFYSIGNHERKLGYSNYKYYINRLTELGVHVIVNGTEKYYIGDDYIVINALKFRENMQPKKLTNEKREKYIRFMQNKIDNIDDKKFNILLSHDPENFEMYKDLGVDMIFSGHDHGGLIRIGKICLLSPRKRLFPKYAYGKYTQDKTTIITSSGMGPARINIRLFNRPEIVEVNIEKIKRKE